MKQLIHILGKDLRRQRWELIGYWGLLAGSGWAEMHPGPRFWQWLPLAALAVGVFAIVRVVQADALVGDRAFWRTRPIRSTWLAAEKVVFCLLAVVAPILLLDVWMLEDAGLDAAQFVSPGMAVYALMIVFFGVLPIGAVAAVTASFVDWVICLVGLVLAIAFCAATGGMVMASRSPSLAGTEYLATSCGVVVVGLSCVFALAWQYGRRQTWVARLVLLFALGCIPLITLGASSPLARHWSYPLRGPATGTWQMAWRHGGAREYVRMNMPMQSNLTVGVGVAGLRQSELVSVEGWRPHLTGDGGWKWDGAWTTAASTVTAEDPAMGLTLSMSPREADAAREHHARLWLELATAVYDLGPSHTVELGANGTKINGLGFCGIMHGRNSWDWEPRFGCRSAWRAADVVRLRIESSESRCQEPVEGGHHASTLLSDESPLAADFDPTPWHESQPEFGNWRPEIFDEETRRARAGKFCAGTPLHVEVGRLVRRQMRVVQVGALGQEVVSQIAPETVDAEQK